MSVFVLGDLDLWSLTLTFKFVQASDQACLPGEFGANPFSGCRDISYTNKKHRLTAPKTEPSAVHYVREKSTESEISGR